MGQETKDMVNPTDVFQSTGTHNITTSKNDITTGTQGITTGMHDITTGMHDITTGMGDITTGMHQITTQKHDITISNNDITTGMHVFSTENDYLSTDFNDSVTALTNNSGEFNQSYVTLLPTSQNTNIRETDKHKEIMHLTVSCIIILFNAVALVVFLTSKKVNKHSGRKANPDQLSPYVKALLVSQSVIDSAAGIFLFANTLWLANYPEHFSGSFDTFLCKYWYSSMPMWVSILTSAYNLVALSFLNLLSVTKPLYMTAYFNMRRVYVMIASAYIPAIVFYIALFEVSSGVKDGKCYQISFWPNEATRLFFSTATYVIVYLIPIIVHAVCYGWILVVLCKKDDFRNNKKLQSGYKMLHMFIAIAIAFFLCFSWNIHILYLFYLRVIELDFKGWHYHISVALLYTNCLVNPIIYTIFYRDFRNQLKALVLKCMGHQRIKQSSIYKAIKPKPKPQPMTEPRPLVSGSTNHQKPEEDLNMNFITRL